MTPEERAGHIDSVADNQGIVEGIGTVYETALFHIRAAIAEDRGRILAIVAGGDRPWQEITAAIRAMR